MADANLSKFLGTATGDFEVADAGDSPRRVPLTDYAFQRSQYPILEELLAHVGPGVIRDSLEDCSPLAGSGLEPHREAQEIFERAQKVPMPNAVDIEIGYVYELPASLFPPPPFSTGQPLWSEIDLDANSDSSHMTEIEREKFDQLLKLSKKKIQIRGGVLICGRDAPPDAAAKAKATADLCRYGGTAEWWDRVEQVASVSLFTWLGRGVARAGQTRTCLRPGSFCVTVAWSQDKVVISPWRARDEYAQPFLPLGTDKNLDSEVEWTVVAAIAGILTRAGNAHPDVAGVPETPEVKASFSLLDRACNESERFRDSVKNIKPVRANFADWAAWIQANNLASLAWYAVGMPPEPPVPNLWIESELLREGHVQVISDSGVKATREDLAKIGMLVQQWPLDVMRNTFEGNNRNGTFSESVTRQNDRWYVCFIVAIGDDGSPRVYGTGVAFGYGGAMPQTLQINLESVDGTFEGLRFLDHQFEAKSSSDGGGEAWKPVAPLAVAGTLAASMLSALSDPKASLMPARAEGGYRFRWNGPDRPEPAGNRHPPQNWPPAYEPKPKGPPKTEQPAVWNFQKLLNRSAAGAAGWEWLWKYEAFRPAKKEDYAEPAPGGVQARIRIATDLKGAVARWKARSVREDITESTIAGYAEDFMLDAHESIVWSAFFGQGPKTFRPTVNEFHALRQVDCHFPVEIYRQPFECLAIEFPSNLGSDEWQTWDVKTGKKADPVALVIYKPEGRPGLFVTILYSTGFTRSLCLPLGLPLPGNDEPSMEDHLEKVSYDREVGEGADPETLAILEAEKHAQLELIRCAITANFLLAQGGHRKIGPADPEATKRLRHQLDAKKARPEVKERARAALLTQPVLYGFHQTIKVYDDNRQPDAAGDAARAGYHVKPHWRRGCFVNQPCGEGRKDRKVIYRKPQFVNSHLFGGSMADTKVTLVRVAAGLDSVLPPLAGKETAT